MKFGLVQQKKRPDIEYSRGVRCYLGAMLELHEESLLLLKHHCLPALKAAKRSATKQHSSGSDSLLSPPGQYVWMD